MAENKETKLIKKELTDLVYDAFRLFYEENQDIIDINIHECTLSSRLAFYLQSLLNLNPNYQKYNDYIVDCEYNRANLDPKIFNKDSIPIEIYKSLVKDCSKNHFFRPDIVIHKRKTTDNLIIFELKKIPSNSDDRNIDICRLKYLTTENNELNITYKLGVFVLIGEKNFNLTFFENGKESYKLCYSKLKS